MGEVKDARAITRIDGLCKTFQNKRLKEKGMHEEDMKNYVEEAAAKAKELLQDGEE
jgi:tripartite-type tricarboxylate transporter receptor subunit TctC